MKKPLLALPLETTLLGQSTILLAAPGASDVVPVLASFADIVNANDIAADCCRRQPADAAPATVMGVPHPSR